MLEIAAILPRSPHERKEHRDVRADASATDCMCRINCNGLAARSRAKKPGPGHDPAFNLGTKVRIGSYPDFYGGLEI
jgi:hypothetical protein